MLLFFYSQVFLCVTVRLNLRTLNDSIGIAMIEYFHTPTINQFQCAINTVPKA